MSDQSGDFEYLETDTTWSSTKPGEEIVVSGIAGRFPDSDNMKHFQENLFNKVDLVSGDDRRWKLDDPEIPQRTGKINNVEKFDSLFFGVHYKQAHTLDPMCRMLLEHAYEAIVDAGVNPRQLRGTNTGVFIGVSSSESEKIWFYQKHKASGFGITGCSRAMLANRVSYWLGANGPSYVVDTACSSSMFALDHAYRAIRSGQCDAALVGGSHLCLHPYVSMQFFRLGVIGADGRCKSFDNEADGYVRSETVAMIFLQKSKDAKRIYARLIHTKTNCDGYKEQGITYPSSHMQGVLLEQFYEECGIPPSILSYLEAHATGTRVGDPEELNAIERVLLPGRTSPLRVGSIKSNLGHSEPASGMCSLAKVVVAMESGFIPPNLHYNKPREGIKALEDGRLKVISELTPWEGGYVGVNSFGFGGANVHALMRSNPKEKIDGGAPKDGLPRLVVVSGRTEEAVTTLLDNLESRPVDVEFVSLFHDIHSEETPGHLYRGYTILPARGLPEPRIRDVQHYPGAKRPVWFIFSGMGSQWAGMGEALLKIPVFARALHKCDAVLKPFGVDLMDIITNKDPTTFDNILNCFIGIAAVQVGLVDVLESVGIVPTHIIGHSAGETACAYADGCFTAEQTVLAAYFRGLASLETEFIQGSMAAIGLGYGELKNLCPPDIEVACHNGPESSTISGPVESMTKFVAKLQASGVFAKEVPCGNIAYHSRYIAAAGPKLLAYLQKVIPEPKPRTEKWLSTSVPRSDWSSESARLSSAEYHTNNLLNPVLFEETSSLIPKDAITIEIAPHGLLQAILRRSLNKDVVNIALTKRGHRDNVGVLLQALGRAYEVGLHPQLKNLYPKVEYPVSRGTQMISPLIRWEHSEDWYVTSYKMQLKVSSGERNVRIALDDDGYEFMAGHMIDGRNLFPATGYLALIWESLGLVRGELYTEIPVVFEDVRFHRATTIPKKGGVDLALLLQKGSGRFEVVEGGVAVVTGLIRAVSAPSQERISPDLLVDNNEDLEVTGRDIYKELRLRGYNYSGVFRGLKSASLDGTKGRVEWVNNWVAFMDNMLQMKMLGIDSRGLFVPTAIRKLVIDTKAHANEVRTMPDENKEFTVRVDNDLDVIVSGGIEIKGLKASAIARKKPLGDPVLEEFKFVAHRDQAELPLGGIARIATHIALEQYSSFRVKTIEMIDQDEDVSMDHLMSPMIREILGDLPLIQADVNVIAPADKFPEDDLPPGITVLELKKLSTDGDALLVIGHGLLTSNNLEMIKRLKTSMKDGGFFLAVEPLSLNNNIPSVIEKEDFDVIVEKRTETRSVYLLRKREKLPKITAIVKINNLEFDWLSKLQEAVKAESEMEAGSRGRVLVVAEADLESGLMGLVNCLRREPGGDIIQGLLIQDLEAPKFSLEDPLYSEQLRLGLALNVLRPRKSWGSYRFLALDQLAMKPMYHARIAQLTRGDLSTIKWVEGGMQPGVEHEDLIKIHYSSLNFRDVMLGTGKLPVEVAGATRLAQENFLGFEYAGRDIQGRGVMGMIGTGAISNMCIGDKELTWPVPDGWTLEEAATVPVVYATAYMALKFSGNMKRGDKVLIHAGSGGVGQAAIHLALFEGCEVFTTVGTKEKREFIRSHFPQIDDDHIGNSRDTSFEELILRQTEGKGVDIVLNSLAEEKLQASVHCLGQCGRFLEIGKFDMAANSNLGMEMFLREISFHGILLDHLFYVQTEKKAQLYESITQGIKSGAVKPLVRTVFPMEQTEAAFRYMAAGKHIGKVLIKIRDEAEVKPTLPLALPRYYCLKDRSYLILGGLGGFGLELVDWLVLRGARKIVLTSRKGISNGYQRMRMNIWKSYGVKIVIIVGKDASKQQDCEFILKEASALGPVDAIFNLAAILKDGIFENQTVESFEELLRVKAWATQQLDKRSRVLCPDLRQFVVFSSAACGRGNAGQSNYGMANSIMERVCETRAAENLPGLAIQWGAIGDVGLVAEMLEDSREIVISGTLQQRISSCLQELDGFLKRKIPVVASMVVAEKRAAGSGPTNIVDTVMNIMGLKDLKTVSLHTPLAELGMDSMMAVEMKQTLEREFEVFLTPQDLRSLNFARLQEISLKKIADEEKVDDIIVENLSGVKMLIRSLGLGESKDICVPLVPRTGEQRGEIFMLPGIEGNHTVFRSMISKLKYPTTCLQLGTTLENLSSIEKMADFLMPHVKGRLQGRRDFVVVGYSFGSLVAIEIVRRLESEGLSGRLVLIDGSPDYMKAVREQHMSFESEDQLQTDILLRIMDLIAPSMSPELAEEFQGCKSFEEKLSSLTSKIPQSDEVVRNTPSLEDQKSMFSAFYHRLRAIGAYDPSALTPLKTPIILLRPKVQSVRLMSEDYGLKSLTKEKVEIYYVEGNHVSMIDDEACASAINGEPIEDAAIFKKSICEDNAHMLSITLAATDGGD